MLVTGEELSDKLLVSNKVGLTMGWETHSGDYGIMWWGQAQMAVFLLMHFSQGLRLPHGNSASWGSDEGHPGNPSTQLPRVSPDLKLVGISP